MKPPLARRLALDILRRTLEQGRDLQAATDDVLGAVPSGPDKGLATELAYGYLRLRGRINFLLDRLFSNPAKTSRALRRILGLAVYELLFLSRIPDYASLDWTVSLTRERLGQSMARVANGVLRGLLRLEDQPRQPEFYQDQDPVRFLSRWFSCPVWLAELWLTDYGREQAEVFLAASLQAPPTGVRVNRLHPDAREVREALEPLACATSTWGAALNAWPEFVAQAVDRGAATRQSLAAQKIMETLGLDDWPDPVLDACAGRGGKTYLLAETGKTVWASDVNSFRLRQFVAEGRRLGIPIPVFHAPAQGPHPLRQVPRTVVLDAPCSGLGVLSRRPDIKWKRTPADCAGLVGLQQDMLSGAAHLLSAGGNLVYVTCTLNRAENEGQIAGFLAGHPELTLLSQETSTDDNLGEFFYGAVLRKR
jgi:16S rRNA (cytosine967-C5)-methyltransferase